MLSEPVRHWRVIIESGSLGPEQVHRELCTDGAGIDGVAIALERSASRFRTSDPALLVATVAAVSSALTALLTGILQRGVAKAGRRVVLELASGAKLDVPADIEPAELEPRVPEPLRIGVLAIEQQVPVHALLRVSVGLHTVGRELAVEQEREHEGEHLGLAGAVVATQQQPAVAKAELLLVVVEDIHQTSA